MVLLNLRFVRFPSLLVCNLSCIVKVLHLISILLVLIASQCSVLIVILPLRVLGVTSRIVLACHHVLLYVIFLNSSEGNKSITFILASTPFSKLWSFLAFILRPICPIAVFLLRQVSFILVGRSLKVSEVQVWTLLLLWQCKIWVFKHYFFNFFMNKIWLVKFI